MLWSMTRLLCGQSNDVESIPTQTVELLQHGGIPSHPMRTHSTICSLRSLQSGQSIAQHTMHTNVIKNDNKQGLIR
jgi:hypothetical protein